VDKPPAALAKRSDKCSIALKCIKKAPGNATLCWQVAILKILAATESGEARVTSIARALSFLIAAGWERRFRRSILTGSSPCIFSDGLADRPAKGVWRILPAGREYLQSFEKAHEIEEASE
jgi:hypothetical protein